MKLNEQPLMHATHMPYHLPDLIRRVLCVFRSVQAKANKPALFVSIGNTFSDFNHYCNVRRKWHENRLSTVKSRTFKHPMQFIVWHFYLEAVP